MADFEGVLQKGKNGRETTRIMAHLLFIDSTPFKISVMQKTVWKQKSNIRKKSVENGPFLGILQRL